MEPFSIFKRNPEFFVRFKRQMSRGDLRGAKRTIKLMKRSN